MRYNRWFVAFLIVSLGCLRPAMGTADDDPCSTNPFEGQDCFDTAPPFFVVVNGGEEHIADRPGTGCQPHILKHPECSACTDTTDPACRAIDVDVELCQAYMATQGLPPGDLYEVCCNCAIDPEGSWVYRIRYFDGTSCPDPGPWQSGLPPGTGGGSPPDEPTTIALLPETTATSDTFPAHPEATDDCADMVQGQSLAVVGLTVAVVGLTVAVIGLTVAIIGLRATHRKRK